MHELEEQQCTCCGKIRPIDEYDWAMGHTSRKKQCKACRNIYLKKWRAKNREKLQKQDKIYNKSYHAKHKERINKRHKLTYHKNREKHLARRKKWHERHPEKDKNSRLFLRYKLTLAQCEAMDKAQEGKCLLCGQDPTITKRGRKQLVVDHCHKTGTVRGLLCDVCNRALGMFQDSPTLLRIAADYLENTIKEAIA